MCFAPQRRALFRHLNFQKWSEHEAFCTIWLWNVLRATTACTFSTSQLLKVLRSWGVLYILTWKSASRHNGVQCFISHLASWLRTRRFSEPTFRPSGATNHWKNRVFRDFLTFSRICIFFLLTLSLLLFFLLIFLFSLPLPISAFHLSILSEVWLLNFLRQMDQYLWLGWCWMTSPILSFQMIPEDSNGMITAKKSPRKYEYWSRPSLGIKGTLICVNLCVHVYLSDFVSLVGEEGPTWPLRFCCSRGNAINCIHPESSLTNPFLGCPSLHTICEG